MRATNNEKRTPGPVTALTNFAASTILDEIFSAKAHVAESGRIKEFEAVIGFEKTAF